MQQRSPGQNSQPHAPCDQKRFESCLRPLPNVCSELTVLDGWRDSDVAQHADEPGVGVLLHLKEWRMVKLYVFASIFGFIAEIICVATGTWWYALPQGFGLPIWLPLLWGSAALYMHEVWREVG